MFICHWSVFVILNWNHNKSVYAAKSIDRLILIFSHVVVSYVCSSAQLNGLHPLAPVTVQMSSLFPMRTREICKIQFLYFNPLPLGPRFVCGQILKNRRCFLNFRFFFILQIIRFKRLWRFSFDACELKHARGKIKEKLVCYSMGLDGWAKRINNKYGHKKCENKWAERWKESEREGERLLGWIESHQIYLSHMLLDHWHRLSAAARSSFRVKYLHEEEKSTAITHICFFLFDVYVCILCVSLSLSISLSVCEKWRQFINNILTRLITWIRLIVAIYLLCSWDPLTGSVSVAQWVVFFTSSIKPAYTVQMFLPWIELFWRYSSLALDVWFLFAFFAWAGYLRFEEFVALLTALSTSISSCACFCVCAHSNRIKISSISWVYHRHCSARVRHIEAHLLRCLFYKSLLFD